jgi:hypothetical protein
MKIEGGCLCGAVRLEAPARPLMIRHCHCIMCRKASGAAFMTGLMYRSEDVRWSGSMKRYESSPGILRYFCETCGGTLAFREAEASEKDCVQLGCFDDPAQIQIDGNVDHIFAERELGWLHLDDGFPRHATLSGGLYKIE